MIRSVVNHHLFSGRSFGSLVRDVSSFLVVHHKPRFRVIQMDLTLSTTIHKPRSHHVQPSSSPDDPYNLPNLAQPETPRNLPLPLAPPFRHRLIPLLTTTTTTASQPRGEKTPSLSLIPAEGGDSRRFC
jgi:hypothetical protein